MEEYGMESVQESRDLVLRLDGLYAEVQQNAQKLDEAKQKGDDAREKAVNVNTGLLNRKRAIEDLKEATIGTADATIDALDCVEQVAENQRHLAEACQEFVKIGAMDITTNRAVVAYLTNVLSEGGDKTLNEEVQEQLVGVVRDLKQREDVMIKQQRQGEKIKDHDSRIVYGEQYDEMQDNQMKDLEARVEQLELLAKNAQKKSDSAVAWVGMALGLAGVVLAVISLML